MSNVSHSLKYYLSDEEREFFNENGYLIIKGLIDLTTVDAIRQKFIDVCNNKTGQYREEGIGIIKDVDLVKTKQKPEDYVNKILDLQNDPTFATHTEHPRLLHALTQLLGQDLSVMNAMMVNKPPGTKLHPPHQDLFYVPLRPFEKVLVAWTAVDPVTAHNGCLFVVPGSHKQGEVHPHVHVPDLVKNLFFAIADVDGVAPEWKRVSLAPMAPGDTVIIHSLAVHGSWPNESNKYRKAMTNVYYSNECQYIDVTGTVQEPFQEEVIKKFIKIHGPDISDFKLEHFWRTKSKRVTMSKSNL